MSHRIRLLAALAALALVGCATVGTGEGVLRGSSGKERVAFAWKTTSGIDGTMSATLPDGVQYFGPFFQITSQSTRQVVAPLWNGWQDWYGWPYWGYGPMTEFVTHYSGKVLANLRAASGEYMRCRFRLAKPAYGIAGGGAGKCETTTGKTYDAYFPVK